MTKDIIEIYLQFGLFNIYNKIMNYFCNMGFDSILNQWWIDVFDEWPLITTTRTFYTTEDDAYIYYDSIINNILPQ